MEEGKIEDVSPNGDGSIMKRIITPGDASAGKPWDGDTVVIHYTGTLEEDGSKFDSSIDRKKKFEFRIGKREAIEEWDVGVVTMNKGEKSVFTIKTCYGFDLNGSPPKVPPNATLVFEIELLDFYGLDLSSEMNRGLVKRTIEAGRGNRTASEYKIIVISIMGKIQGESEAFDDREEVKFIVGEGFELDIPDGVEAAIKTMKHGEKAEVTIRNASKYAKEVLASLANANKDTVLIYTVLLKKIRCLKAPWCASVEENLESAKFYKEKGVTTFKNGQYLRASKYYDKCISCIQLSPTSSKDLKEDNLNKEAEEVLKAGHLNKVMCHLKLKEDFEARQLCDIIIHKHEDSEKAFFRRGEALLNLNEPFLAKADFLATLNLNPDNKAAKNKLAEALNKIKEHKKKDANTYANMFEKFAHTDVIREKKAYNQVKIDDWNNDEDSVAS